MCVFIYIYMYLFITGSSHILPLRYGKFQIRSIAFPNTLRCVHKIRGVAKIFPNTGQE